MDMLREGIARRYGIDDDEAYAVCEKVHGDIWMDGPRYSYSSFMRYLEQDLCLVPINDEKGA